MSENTSGEPADEPVADAPSDRTLSWWPLLAAVVVAAVFLTIVFTVGSDGDSGPGTERDDNGALSCPAAYKLHGHDAWVPADASGVDGSKSLVPNAKPSHVTLCSYRSSSTSRKATVSVRLAGQRQLSDGARDMARDLSRAAKAPKGSGLKFEGAEPPEFIYLVGMTFATGFVWVSASDASATTNGDFTASTAALWPRIRQAFDQRQWK